MALMVQFACKCLSVYILPDEGLRTAAFVKKVSSRDGQGAGFFAFLFKSGVFEPTHPSLRFDGCARIYFDITI